MAGHVGCGLRDVLAVDRGGRHELAHAVPARGGGAAVDRRHRRDEHVTTYCSLLAARYSLLTTHYSLLTTHYSLRTTGEREHKAREAAKAMGAARETHEELKVKGL